MLDSCKQLELEGFEVTYLQPGADGVIHPKQLHAALRDDTLLVSLMHVNNEIGTINDIAALGELAHAAGAIMHVDAAQSTGKLPIDLRSLPVDLMSFCAHKTYGPKGIGALFVRRDPQLKLEALIHGGGHERGMRSGTLATHQIVGMGEAFALAGQQMQQEDAHIRALRQRLLEGLSGLPGVSLNGSDQQRIPHNLNLAFAGVDGELLLLALKDLALSSGSACNSASVGPSFVLRAIGIPDALAHSSLRLSIGRFSQPAEMDAAARILVEVVTRLRQTA